MHVGDSWRVILLQAAAASIITKMCTFLFMKKICKFNFLVSIPRAIWSCMKKIRRARSDFSNPFRCKFNVLHRHLQDAPADNPNLAISSTALCTREHKIKNKKQNCLLHISDAEQGGSVSEHSRAKLLPNLLKRLVWTASDTT